MTVIDLRSDTVTQPTPAMRRAMAEAEVGDDVFGEDPSVRLLEEIGAERLGKEAALFVASGTMANLVCQLTHCGRGAEMLLGDQAHIFYYEQGGSAALGGIHPRIVPNQPDGTMDLKALEAAIRPDDAHFPKSRLIALENTHNRCSGTPVTAEYTAAVGKLARRHDMALHIDGARIFNAAVALGVSAAQLAAPADSVSCCLSKGLCAPVGSLVCGTRAFIAQARRNRKVIGGGMRQAGIIAAAGIVAITDMVDRLAEDHANARKLAASLCAIDGLKVDLNRVSTNIVYIDLDRLSPQEVIGRLAENNVRVLASGPQQLRAVTHHPITGTDMDRAADAFSRAMKP